MILTDYYKFKKLAKHAKLRLECVASTQSYNVFENAKATKATKATEKRDAINVGDIIIYCNNVPDQFKGNVKRRADKSLTLKGKNLSSVFVPDITKQIGYGDIKDTTDAILLVFHGFKSTNTTIKDGAEIEIFIARGYSKNRVGLYNIFSDGELDGELNELRKKARQIKEKKE